MHASHIPFQRKSGKSFCLVVDHELRKRPGARFLTSMDEMGGGMVKRPGGRFMFENDRAKRPGGRFSTFKIDSKRLGARFAMGPASSRFRRAGGRHNGAYSFYSRNFYPE